MKNKIYYSYGKRVLFTSLTAAALSLAAGNLDTVKAASLTACRSALRKSTKTKKKTVHKSSKVNKMGSAAGAESPTEIKQDQATAQDAGSADSVTVKAHYVNQKGEQIAPDETLTGKLNDPYPDKEIAGYEIVTKPKGQFSAAEPEITYVYADSSTQNEEAAGQDSQAKIATRSISNTTWRGLKVTFDNSTGLLTIPGGTVRDTRYLYQVVANGDKAIKKIKFTGPLKITGSADSMFEYLENLTEIEGLQNLDTSEVTSMREMFGHCKKLTSLDVSGFVTSNVRDMFAMFWECQSLTSLDVSKFNTAKVADMMSMFLSCNSLISLDVSGFVTANVKNMYGMFSGCEKLTSLDVSGFNTAKVTDLRVMFQNCSSLTSLDVSNFKMTSATSRQDMLNGLSQLNTLILGEDNNLNGVGLNNSGVWVNVGKGTMDQPEGSKKWKSAELMANYNGQTDHDTYVRFDAAVIVHYQDEKGVPVASNETLTGKVGEKYESKPKEIAGYVLKSSPKDASGTFTNADQEIIYVYTNKVTVTAHYVDQDGQEISQEQITGKIGDLYPDKKLPGYVQVSKPDGTFSPDKTDVTYKFTNKATVTAHYVDQDGREISQEPLTGTIGKPYPDKKLPGYVQVSKPDGTFSPDKTDVTYQFTNKVTVTAHYVDQDGREISQEQITGKIGNPYPDQPLEGYVQVSKPKGNFSDSEKEVTYVYAKQGKVTAHYIDQNTKEAIIPDATLTGKIGDPYPDQPLEGYVQVSKPKGTFSDSEKDVTYVYTKTVSPGTDPTVPGTDPAVKGAIVTVHYQDAKGNPLAPDEILSGKVGEGYVSTAKTIAGYELVNRPENATGFFSQNPQSVTYIYAPVESNSGKQPGQNNQTGGGSNNSQGSSQASHGKEKQPHNDHANSNSKQQTGKTAPVQPEHKSPAGKQNKVTKEVAETEGTAQLAQTGSAEKEQGAALTLGSLSLLGGLIGSWFNRRKKKDYVITKRH